METNNMISFIIGAAAGVAGGMVLKDKLIPSNKENQLASMVNNLSDQNNTLKSKCNDLEKRLAQSKSEIETLKSKINRYEDKGDDADDAIADLQKANKKLLAEKESIASDLEETKSLLTLRMQEIEDLKNKIFELTNKYRKSLIKEQMSRFRILSRLSKNIRTFLWVKEGVCRSFAAYALTTIQKRYPRYEDFFRTEYDLSAEDITKIRDMYLE